MRTEEWALTRDWQDDITLGEMRYAVHDSERVCYTVEDSALAVPCGRYRLTITPHGKSILVNGAGGFRHVEICAGSDTSRNAGAITVGDERVLAGIGNSISALARLITELRRLTIDGVPVWLTVREAE